MSVTAIHGTRCEIVLQTSILGNGKMQCPNPAVGFWSPSRGIWHPVCLNHLESIQAANLLRPVTYLPIEQEAESDEAEGLPVPSASEAPAPPPTP